MLNRVLLLLGRGAATSTDLAWRRGTCPVLTRVLLLVAETRGDDGLRSVMAPQSGLVRQPSTQARIAGIWSWCVRSMRSGVMDTAPSATAWKSVPGALSST